MLREKVSSKDWNFVKLATDSLIFLMRSRRAAEGEGFSVIRDFVGHGVGQQMHEDPQIPNYGRPGRGPRLASGMVFAIEPMICQGAYDVETLSNDWTVVTLDGKLAAHYENTVVITDGEPQLLTLVE